MNEYDLMAVVYRAYVALLAAVCLGCIFQSREDLRLLWRKFIALHPIRRTAIVLFGNWVANTAFVAATGIHDPWGWYLVVDALSAFLVIYQPAWRPQAIIAGLYMGQLVTHVLYASGSVGSENHFWQILIGIAFAQLVVLGGWYIGMGWRALLDRWRGHGMARAKGRNSVA